MAHHFPDQSRFLPQKASTDTVYASVTEGDFLVLHTDLGINAQGVTGYRWVKNGVPLFPNFQQNAFEFTDTSFSCEYYPAGSSGPTNCNGVYHVEIQNSQLPAGTVLKGPPSGYDDMFIGITGGPSSFWTGCFCCHQCIVLKIKVYLYFTDIKI